MGAPSFSCQPFPPFRANRTPSMMGRWCRDVGQGGALGVKLWILTCLVLFHLDNRVMSLFLNFSAKKSRTDVESVSVLQMNFWKVYLRSYSSESPTTASAAECDELSKEQEASLEKEGLYGAALSHLFWAVWSFLQSFKSDIQFGYTVSSCVRKCNFFDSIYRRCFGILTFLTQALLLNFVFTSGWYTKLKEGLKYCRIVSSDLQALYNSI